jgi:hypothetical protein
MHRGHAAQPSSVHADGLVLPLPMRAIDWLRTRQPSDECAHARSLSDSTQICRGVWTTLRSHSSLMGYDHIHQ